MRLHENKAFTLVEIVVVIAIAAMILTGVFIVARDANKSSRDAQRRNAVGQVQLALEQWATTHSGSYFTDQKLMVQLSNLYGDCGVNQPLYLDCGINAPGTGRHYTDASTNQTTTDSISITARDGTLDEGDIHSKGGYCIRVGLESLDVTTQAYGVSDVNKTGRTMAPPPAPCS